MAQGYINQRVRIRLGKNDFRIVGGEIHIWLGDQSEPPVIICRGQFSNLNSSITIIGICKSLNRDGKWRSPSCDFFVVIDDCIVTVQ